MLDASPLWNILLFLLNLTVSCKTFGKRLARTQPTSVCCNLLSASQVNSNRWGEKWMMHTDKNTFISWCKKKSTDFSATAVTGALCNSTITYTCVSSQKHIKYLWIVACLLFFCLKWVFLYRFHKWEQQTSSFIPLFWSLDPLFPFPSSLSGQVRLDSK